MKVDLNIRYTGMVVPPRCRKPRPEEGVATISVNIKDVPAERAPVAFIVKEFERQRREVRLYAGKLYRQIQDQRDRSQDCESNMPLWITQRADQVNWQWRMGNMSGIFRRCKSPYWDYGTLKANAQRVRSLAKKFIVVDGFAYELTGEPYYSVTCFGLGNNHGGTGLFVGWSYRSNKNVFGYTPLDKNAAINSAVEIASRRGDTDDIESLRACTFYDINVLIPSAVKRTYKIY